MTPSLRSIRRSVAQSLSISIRRVDAGCQTPTAVLARHVTMYVARKELRLTLEEVGREMRRHNSSVMHGCGRVSMLIRQGDERALSAIRAGEVAAAQWKKLSPRDEMRERRERLEQRAREMLVEAARIGVAMGERVSAAE